MDRRVPTVSFTHDKHSPDGSRRPWQTQYLRLEWPQLWGGAGQSLGLLEGGGVVRIGAVHYNTAEEIEETLGAVEAIVARKPL